MKKYMRGVLALWAFSGAVPATAAPDEPDARLATETDDTGGTRISIESELPPIRVQFPTPQSKACQAEIGLTYGQKNTVADVEGTIDHAQCGASSGDYTIAVSIRNANGELQTLEFPETWQRSDSAPVTFTAEYPIGENVDLLRVRTRLIHCTCDDVPVDAPVE